MPFLNFNSAKPSIKLLIVLLAIVTIGIIVFVAGLLLSRIIFWMHLDEVNNVLYGRFELLTDWQLKYFQLVQTIGFFLIPGFFLHWIFSKEDHKYFEIKTFPRLRNVILVFLLFLVGMPLLSWLIELNQNIEFPYFMRGVEDKLQGLENSYADLTKRLLVTHNFGQYLFNILMIAILPAIGEELIFRGVFQKLFLEINRNIHFAVIAAALIFSIIHGQFYGLLPRFILGIFFGYLMVWSGTIWLPIIAHFINNAIAVTSYYLLETGKLSSESPLLEGKFNYFVVLLSGVLVAAILVLLRKTGLKKST